MCPQQPPPAVYGSISIIGTGKMISETHLQFIYEHYECNINIYFLIFRLLLCYFLYPESSPRSPKCNAQHQNFAWGKFWPFWAQFLNVIAQKQSAQLLLYYYLYNTLAQKHATTTKSLFGWLCPTFYAKVHFKLDFLENSVKILFYSMFFF